MGNGGVGANGVRVLGRKTLELMFMNHFPEGKSWHDMENDANSNNFKYRLPPRNATAPSQCSLFPDRAHNSGRVAMGSLCALPTCAAGPLPVTLR